MKLVGVISDTHGALSVHAAAALAECDAIIHAGDIINPDTIRELRALAPTYAVLGNNDIPEFGSDVAKFARPVIDGVNFLVSHKPNDVCISKFGSSVLAPGDPIPKVRIHGHTHVPLLLTGKDASPSELLMNPGAVYAPRGGNPKTVGKVVVDNGTLVSAWIETLDGEEFLRFDW